MIAAVLVVVVASMALYAPRAVEKKLEGGDVRELVSRHTAQELQMAAGFKSLEWQGLEVKSDGLLARSPDPSRSRELHAHQIQAEASLSDLQSRRIRVKTLSVAHLEMAFGEAALKGLQDTFASPPELLQPTADDGSVTWDTQIEKLESSRTDLYWGQEEQSTGHLRDVAVMATRQGEGNYRLQGKGGVLRQSGWPELTVRTFTGGYADKTLTIETSDLTLGEGGEVHLSGQISDKQGRGEMLLKIRAERCPAAPFLSEELRGKFAGTFATEAEMRRGAEESAPGRKPNQEQGKKAEAAGVERRSTEILGKISFAGASVKGIEALNRAAEFTEIRRFKHLELDVLEGEYEWRDGELEVKDFVAEAQGLVRMEGHFKVKKREIRGTFKLGASHEVIGAFPGAEGSVFTRRGGSEYGWTTVHLTGSLDHPDEDLKPRLVAAAKAYYAKKFLAPILKPGKLIIEAIESLY